MWATLKWFAPWWKQIVSTWKLPNAIIHILCPQSYCVREWVCQSFYLLFRCCHPKQFKMYMQYMFVYVCLCGNVKSCRWEQILNQAKTDGISMEMRTSINHPLPFTRPLFYFSLSGAALLAMLKNHKSHKNRKYKRKVPIGEYNTVNIFKNDSPSCKHSPKHGVGVYLVCVRAAHTALQSHLRIIYMQCSTLRVRKKERMCFSHFPLFQKKSYDHILCHSYTIYAAMRGYISVY